jgi:tRNA(fMet)-specific endonuclease VapC
VFGRVRSDLERKGTVIGPYDLQIASIAIAHDLVLVTNNIKEFKRVDGLNLENWV